MNVLHVGCGRTALPPMFDGCKETRLDIDPGVEPDIIASMTDLGDIGGFDAVFSSHCLEHLYPHEIAPALSEIRRVTKGFAFIVVPDLEGLPISDETLYEVNGNKISPLDMIYGKASYIAASPHMAHHSGFTQALLLKALEAAGFATCLVIRGGGWNLCGIAFAVSPPEAVLEKARQLTVGICGA